MKTQFPNDFAEATVEVFYMERSGHLFGWDRDGDPTFEVFADPAELNDWIVNQVKAQLTDTEVEGAKEVRVDLAPPEFLALVRHRWK